VGTADLGALLKIRSSRVKSWGVVYRWLCDSSCLWSGGEGEEIAAHGDSWFYLKDLPPNRW